MRAAAILPVAIIAIGAYLLIAASLLFPPAWIAFGVLAIAVTMAIAMVDVERRATLSR